MPTPSEIQTCIDNLTTSNEPIELTILSAQVSQANTGVAFSVNTVDDLFDLETERLGDGQIVFVESIGVPVVSAGNKWLGLDGRILQRVDGAEILSWGFNGSGELGIGNFTTTDALLNTPTPDASGSIDWCMVCAGRNAALGIKESGELWGWGSGSCGNLGNGTTTSKDIPTREISYSTDWCQVSFSMDTFGSCHAAAVKTSGQIWSWGGAANGPLGDGTVTDKCSPVREISSSTDWCQVAAGGQHTAAIKTSGQLWAWGANRDGALGIGCSTSQSRCSPVRERCSANDWCAVHASLGNTAAVKTTGQIWTWGNGQCGRLGNGSTANVCSPVREISSATDWCQVNIGPFHMMAIKTTGEMWGWGGFSAFNSFVPDGTQTSRCSAVREICSATNWCQVSSGGRNSRAIKTDGTLWSWGSGDCGTLLDGCTNSVCSPVRETVFGSTNWCQVSQGTSHASAIKIMD